MTYTDQFPQNVLRRFTQDQRETIAVEHGWRGKIMSDGGMRMVPPPGLPDTITPIYFPQKRMTSNALLAVKRMIVRAVHAQARHDGEDSSPKIKTAFGELSVVETADEQMGGAALIVEQDPGFVVEEAVAAGNDVIVSERPFLARARVAGDTAQQYMSSTTIERQWLSGKVDYRCAECDYESHKAKSVRNHYRVHGKAVVNRTIVATTDDVEPIYDTAVRRLEKELREVLNTVSLPDQYDRWPEVIAKALVQRRRERREVMEHDDPEPLTPEQVLARVRSIVAPEMLANEARLTEQVRYLNEMLEQTEAARLDAKAQAEQAQETLDTLVSLVSDIKRGGASSDDRVDEAAASR